MSGTALLDVLLQISLRPEPIRRMQETYLDTVEIQLIASVLLLALAALGGVVASRIQETVRSRYGTNLGEAATLAVLILVVGCVVYGFSVIWHVTYALEYTVDSMAIPRWYAAQQLVTAAIIVTAYLAARFVNRSIDKLAETKALTKHQSEVAYHVSDVTIIGAAGTLVLTIWGVDLTNVFIGAGAITAIVALTARETLAAMLAGFILLFSRPFRVGEWIEVNDTTGIVTDVTIFTTKIQTFDDNYVLIPNDEVTSSPLTNYSRNDQLRVDVEVSVDYDTDVEHARSVAADAVEELESVKPNPTPQVIAKEFGDSAILLELRAWIGDPTMRRKLDARTDTIEAVHEAFDREGISIPYPQRVHAAREDGLRITDPRHEENEAPTVDD